MESFGSPDRRADHHHLRISSRLEFSAFIEALGQYTAPLYRFLLLQKNHFWIQLFYFIFISFIGFLVLKLLPQKNSSAPRPKDFDLFFMSLSANTVSSMSTVEMETFSNTQLLVLTLLMLLGGEVFTSMLGLMFDKKNKFCKREASIDGAGLELSSQDGNNNIADEIGLDSVKIIRDVESLMPSISRPDLRYSCVRCLRLVVLGYLVVAIASGFTFIRVYLSLVPSALAVLQHKEIDPNTFSIFTTVSTFTNCGFVPTNENMMVFKSCSGLLLSVGSLVLAGNTLYPPCLRSVMWTLKRLSRRPEFDYILSNSEEVGYDHLLPMRRSLALALTGAGFAVVQLLLFCCMEWRSEGLHGLNSYQKIVGGLFQSLNSRHAGESIVDLSAISSAILVLFVVLMYLPPYATFLPIDEDGGPLKEGEDGKTRERLIVKGFIFSQLTYLAIFTIIICITERRQLVDDPLNFNVLNIVVEVVSAYGNVGFSTGYSCKRRLKGEPSCKDLWTGFSGRWSTKGKLTLILVMLFGRLKKYSTAGGKAWKLN